MIISPEKEMLILRNIKITRVLLNRGIAQLRLGYPQLVIDKRRIGYEFIYKREPRSKLSDVEPDNLL